MRRWIVLLLGLGIALAIREGEAGELRLEEVIRSASETFPSVRAAGADLEGAEGDALVARGGFDPTLRSSLQSVPRGQYEYRYLDSEIEQPTTLWGTRLLAGYRRSYGEIPFYDGQWLTDPNGEARVGLGIPLLRGGAIDERRARLEVTRQDLAIQRANVRQQRVESVRTGTLRYIDWVTAGEKLEVARNLFKLARDRDEAIRQRVQRGDAAEVEWLDNTRTVVQRESGVVRAVQSLESASIELSLYLRDSDGRPRRALEQELPRMGLLSPVLKEQFRSRIELLASHEVSATVSDHPDVLRLRGQAAQVQVEYQLASNAILPRLDAEMFGTRDLGPEPTSRTGNEFRFAVRLEVPLLFRAALGRQDVASARRYRIRWLTDLAEERVRNGIADLRQIIGAAQARIALAEREVELAMRVEKAERIRLRAGDSNILTVNLREQATVDAQVRLIDSRAELYRAQANLVAAGAVEI